MTNKVKKVLIVEDEKPLSNVLQLKLNEEGMETQTAYDGEEAVRKIEANGYDLVLLDLILPVKDGFEVLKELQEKNIKVPIIVVSNLGQEEDIEKTRKLGVKGYLVKANSTLDDIVKVVKKFLG